MRIRKQLNNFLLHGGVDAVRLATSNVGVGHGARVRRECVPVWWWWWWWCSDGVVGSGVRVCVRACVCGVGVVWRVCVVRAW